MSPGSSLGWLIGTASLGAVATVPLLAAPLPFDEIGLPFEIATAAGEVVELTLGLHAAIGAHNAVIDDGMRQLCCSLAKQFNGGHGVPRRVPPKNSLGQFCFQLNLWPSVT